MNRRKFALAVYLLLFALTGFAGLSSCGGGGSSGTGGEVMITPAGNRAPEVARAFAGITINLGEGGPAEWASGELGANFSDPDGDQLSYAVGSSDESVAVAGISEPGPIVMVRGQSVGDATITITARDPGGLTATASFEVVVSEEPEQLEQTSLNLVESEVRALVPDLVVSSTVSDDTLAAGAAFTLSARVWNTGGAASGSTTLRYYLSTDETITRSDTPLGTDAVPALGAAVTSSESISVTAPSSPGIYYYGACVDAVTGESGTRNNCSSAVRVTVPSSSPVPDLVVVSPTASVGETVVGGSFTLSATVINAGGGASGSTTLRYYRSMDTTITRSDTEVGTAAVPALASAGNGSESISVTAPSSAGIYYYGACVEPVAGEPGTTNNCTPSVTVRAREPRPVDLAMDAPTVRNSRPTPGAYFYYRVTVRNTGDSRAPSTALVCYHSADARITTSDTSLGRTSSIGSIAAGGTYRTPCSTSAPSSPGRYYYGACVEPVAGEPDTENNCTPSVAVTVVSANLVVGPPSVSDSSPAPGTAFTLSATVRNTGDGGSTPTTLRYYRSTDTTITTSDTPVSTAAVDGLAAAGTSSLSISLTTPSTPGPYYYGACVDPVIHESGTADNCSLSVTVTVPPRVDLVVGSPTVSTGSPAVGTAFTLSASVSNTGNGASASTTLRYYRSTDARITASDTEVGTDAVPALAAAGTSSESISVSAPPSSRIYYYGACVDTVTYESDTTDNCSSAVRVTVLSSSSGPDLVVVSPTASAGKTVIGTSFTLSATVINLGRGASASTTLRYYRSTDAAITTSDTEVGTATTVGALAAAGTSSGSTSVTAPSISGAWYYGACVNTVTSESDTGNNCSPAVRVTVLLKPDLEVTSYAHSSTLSLGYDFTLSAWVRNTGGGPSRPTWRRYYRSEDETITTSDTEVGWPTSRTHGVRALDAGEISRLSISVVPPYSHGTYYYGACVDAVANESDTGNNCSPAVTVTVLEPAPNLIVGSPKVSAASPAAGTDFTLSATVWNAGRAASGSTTLRYYRSADATITTSDTSEGTDAVPVLYGRNTSKQSVSVTAPSTPGIYYYGACVDVVARESDTGNNCSTAVRVTVQ